MKKFLKTLHGIEAFIAGLFLALMTIVTFAAAVNRFTFKIPMPWSEELVRYLLLWDSIMAATYGISVNAHVGIDVISSKLKGRSKAILKILTSVCAIVFLVIMFVYGLKLTMNGALQRSPAMQIPMSWVNASLPVGAVCMIIEFITIVVNETKSLIPGKADKEITE